MTVKKRGVSQLILVDDEDARILSEHKWRIDSQGYVWRCAYSKCGSRRIALHRAVMGVVGQPGDIDHINGNKLDNRKENLRLCSRVENLWNQKSRGGISGMKGVYWYAKKKKWGVYLMKNYKRHFFGYFNVKEDAFNACVIATSALHGEFARKEAGSADSR